MAKRAIVMYLEQARIYGEDLSVTRSEVLLTKPDGNVMAFTNSKEFVTSVLGLQ